MRVSCLIELGHTWLIQLIESKAESHINASDGDQSHEFESKNEVGKEKFVDFSSDKDLFNNDRSDVMNIADSVGVFSHSSVENTPGAPSMDLDPTDADTANELMIRLGEDEERLSKMLEEERQQIIISDHMAVQEQGLNFIQNLICPPGQVEMIDFLFKTIGEAQVFSALMSVLRPKALENVWTHSPRDELLVAATAIIIHIAGGHPRHRLLLLQQTELFRLMIHLFDHPNKNVRVNLAWIVINLTWMDHESDRLGCKLRALELKKLGFLSKLECLEHDSELDVKERTKTAMSQVKNHIDGP